MEKSSLFLFEKRKLIVTTVLVSFLSVVCFYSFNFSSYEHKSIANKDSINRKLASIPKTNTFDSYSNLSKANPSNAEGDLSAKSANDSISKNGSVNGKALHVSHSVLAETIAKEKLKAKNSNAGTTLRSDQTLVWDCQSNVNNLEVSGEYLRLLAKNCDTLRTQILSVKNVTNGYTASLIPTKENVLTTDFLSLRTGKNEIWIETKALGFSAKTYKFNVEKNASVGVREAKE
jgi:hypothetical protein